MNEKPLNKIGSLAGKLFKKTGIIVIAVLAVIYLFFQVLDSNDADSTIVLQSITGNISVITEPGPYFRFFGTPHKYKKVIAVNFTGDRGGNRRIQAR